MKISASMKVPFYFFNDLHFCLIVSSKILIRVVFRLFKHRTTPHLGWVK
jgi:hypothetical protein